MEQILDHGQLINIIHPDNLESVLKKYEDEFHEKCIKKGGQIIQRKNNELTDYHKKMVDFFRLHSDSFSLGYCYRNNNPKALPDLVEFYKGMYGYQRFQFENSQCLSCSAKWRIANPAYLGIYPDYEFDISELKYPLLKCPNCGGELSRPAIWCERTDF